MIFTKGHWNIFVRQYLSITPREYNLFKFEITEFGFNTENQQTRVK